MCHYSAFLFLCGWVFQSCLPIDMVGQFTQHPRSYQSLSACGAIVSISAPDMNAAQCTDIHVHVLYTQCIMKCWAKSSTLYTPPFPLPLLLTPSLLCSPQHWLDPYKVIKKQVSKGSYSFRFRVKLYPVSPIYLFEEATRSALFISFGLQLVFQAMNIPLLHEMCGSIWYIECWC